MRTCHNTAQPCVECYPGASGPTDCVYQVEGVIVPGKFKFVVPFIIMGHIIFFHRFFTKNIRFLLSQALAKLRCQPTIVLLIIVVFMLINAQIL